MPPCVTLVAGANDVMLVGGSWEGETGYMVATVSQERHCHGKTRPEMVATDESVTILDHLCNQQHIGYISRP